MATSHDSLSSLYLALSSTPLKVSMAVLDQAQFLNR